MFAITDLRSRWLPSWRSPSLIARARIDRPVIEYCDSSFRIEGVVSPLYQHHQSGLHTFQVAAWKRPDGPLLEEDLYLIRPIPPGHGEILPPVLSDECARRPDIVRDPVFGDGSDG